MPQLDISTFPSQIFWLIVCFAVLYVLMAKLAVPKIESVVEGRRNRIEGDLEKAAQMKAEAEAVIAAYEKALADARARAQAIAAETRQQQVTESDQMRKSIEGKLDVKLAEAERTINATKTQAMANVRGIAVEAAGAIVERLIGTLIPEQELAAAVDDVLKR